MQIQRYLSKVFNSSRIFIITAIFANLVLLLQLYSFEFLPLGDWIPHIYNSRIIKDLLFYPGSGTDGFYEMYFSHFTNITDHFMMALLMTFLPATVASQVVIGFVPVIMQIGMYRLLKALKINVWWTFIIIPFIFNSLFIGGMINYNIGIGLMFLLLGSWINYFRNRASTWNLILILTLPVLIYITHIFIYGITGLLTGIFIITTLLMQSERKIGAIFSIKKLFQSLIFFVGSNLLPAVIFLTYFFTKTSITSSVSTSNFSLQPLVNLFSLRILIGYTGAAEGHALNLLYIALGVIILFGLLTIFFPYFQKGETDKEVLSDKHGFMISMIIVAVIFLAGLLFVPAKVTGAGACLDKRLELLLHITILLIFILLIHKFKYEHLLFLLVIPFFISTVLHLSVLDRLWNRDSYPVAHHLMEISDEWPELSTVMVVSRDTKWYMAHIGNATGIRNRVVNYENYEAGGGHFMTARVEGNPLIQIDKHSRFFGHNEVAWDLVIPNNEPDYLILLQKENPIALPEVLYQRFDTISNESVGAFHIVEMRRVSE